MSIMDYTNAYYSSGDTMSPSTSSKWRITNGAQTACIHCTPV